MSTSDQALRALFPAIGEPVEVWRGQHEALDGSFVGACWAGDTVVAVIVDDRIAGRVTVPWHCVTGVVHPRRPE